MSDIVLQYTEKIGRMILGSKEQVLRTLTQRYNPEIFTHYIRFVSYQSNNRIEYLQIYSIVENDWVFVCLFELIFKTVNNSLLSEYSCRWLVDIPSIKELIKAIVENKYQDVEKPPYID